MTALKERLNEIKSIDNEGDFWEDNKLFIDTFKLFDRENKDISKEDIENFKSLYIEKLRNYECEQQEMIDEFFEYLTVENQGINFNKDFLIKIIDDITQYATNNNLSSVAIITNADYLSDYDEETTAKIHNILSLNTYDYYSHIYFENAFYELNDPRDIVKLFEYNEGGSFKEHIQHFADCVLEDGRDIEILGEVLNIFVSNINSGNIYYEELKETLFDRMEEPLPILSYIYEPENIIVQDYSVDIRLLNKFIKQKAITQTDIANIVEKMYFNDVIDFFETTEIENLSTKVIDVAFNILKDNAYYIDKYNVDTISKVLAHYNKYPSDYFDMEEFDEDLLEDFNTTFEIERTSIQISRF